MGPIDYSIDVQNPFMAALEGYKGGAMIRNDQQQQEQYQQQLLMQKQQQELQQQQLEQQRQMQQNWQQFATKPNKTAEDYSQAFLMFPGMKEGLTKSFETLNEAQRQTKLGLAGQVLAAMETGNNEYAASIFEKQAAGLEASGGDQQEIQAFRDQAKLVKDHPDTAKSLAGMFIAANDPSGKIIQGLSTLGQESREKALFPSKVIKSNAEATVAQAQAKEAPTQEQIKTQGLRLSNKNIESLIQERADRAGIDRDKVLSDMQLRRYELELRDGVLPEAQAKAVDESVTQASISEAQVTSLNQVAEKFDSMGDSWGTVGTAAAAFKKFLGNEDAITSLRQEYNRIASLGVLKLLPPGPATDKDIALAREGIPDQNANPKVIAGYLRGMAKLSAYEAAYQDAKADWLSQARTLGAVKRDIEVGGVKVPAGVKFNDFVKTYIQKRADEINNDAIISNRSYMRHAGGGGGQQSANEGSW